MPIFTHVFSSLILGFSLLGLFGCDLLEIVEIFITELPPEEEIAELFADNYEDFAAMQ